MCGGSDGISVSVQDREVMTCPGLTGPSPTCIATSYKGLNMASGLWIAYAPMPKPAPSEREGHLVTF